MDAVAKWMNAFADMSAQRDQLSADVGQRIAAAVEAERKKWLDVVDEAEGRWRDLFRNNLLLVDQLDAAKGAVEAERKACEEILTGLFMNHYGNNLLRPVLRGARDAIAARGKPNEQD